MELRAERKRSSHDRPLFIHTTKVMVTECLYTGITIDGGDPTQFKIFIPTFSEVLQT